MAPTLKADVVFLSPPWGGPSYIHEETYDLETMLQPVAFSTLIAASKNISQNIAVFLPRNTNTYDVSKFKIPLTDGILKFLVQLSN